MNDLRGLNVCVGALQNDKAAKAALSGARTVVISSTLGVVLGTVGGALLWKAHRVAGALIGGLLVGPAVGWGVGMTIATSKMKDAV